MKIKIVRVRKNPWTNERILNFLSDKGYEVKCSYFEPSFWGVKYYIIMEKKK